VARTAVGLVALVALGIIGCLGILSLSDASPDRASTVLVWTGSALVLAFALAPALTGTSDPLDPRRFAVFGLPPRGLIASLSVASLISVPLALVVAFAVSGVVVRVGHGASPALATVGAILAILTCAFAGRVGFALSAIAVREGRGRSLVGLVALAVLAGAVPVGVYYATATDSFGSPIDAAAEVLALTPLGAAWAVGDPNVNAPIAIVIPLATLVVLWVTWAWLARRLVSGAIRSTPALDYAGLGWFGMMPGTPGGAIAARSMIYWLHDRRYLMNVVIVPVAAAISIVPLLVAGVPFEIAILVPVLLAALFLGWLPHDDVAYDSTAVWMHVASDVHGVPDRVGRLAPILLLATPVLAIAVLFTVVLHGSWDVFPAMAGVCASLYLSGLGLSSIASVVAPYAVTRPGDSPFRQPQRTGSSGVIAQGAVLLGSVVISAPTVLWTWRSVQGEAGASIMALVVGVGIGLAVLIIGVAIGGALFRRRGGRLLELAETA
jgi:ABC-2 type transport system permease protein